MWIMTTSHIRRNVNVTLIVQMVSQWTKGGCRVVPITAMTIDIGRRTTNDVVRL